LRFDPRDGVAIALRALAPVAKLGQAFEGGLVTVEIEPVHQNLDRVRRCRRLGRLLCPATVAALRRRDERYPACHQSCRHQRRTSKCHRLFLFHNDR